MPTRRQCFNICWGQAGKPPFSQLVLSWQHSAVKHMDESGFELKKPEFYKNTAELLNACQLTSEPWNIHLMRQINNIALKTLLLLLANIHPSSSFAVEKERQWDYLSRSFRLHRGRLGRAMRSCFFSVCQTPTIPASRPLLTSNAITTVTV